MSLLFLFFLLRLWKNCDIRYILALDFFYFYIYFICSFCDPRDMSCADEDLVISSGIKPRDGVRWALQY